MSSPLAIASVSAILMDLLNNAMIDRNVTGAIGGNVTVTALPPDRIDTAGAPQSQLNLFLYQVTPNQGWRNVGLPSHNDQGDRIGNPPLALDLHYLLTAYGASDLHAEILLGYGMQLFHETPVLTRDSIRKSLAPPSQVVGGGGLPPAMQALFTSELAEQVEQIKICPLTLSTEEISKLWAAFQAKYRPTAAYQASVVLIETKRSIKTALPVRERIVRVLPFANPVIEQVQSQKKTGDPIVANQPILAGYNLVLIGRELRGDRTFVSIGGGVPFLPDSVSATQVIFTIPPGTQAGVQGVQVLLNVMLGSPPTEHRGFESNVEAFVLRPNIVGPISITNLQGSGAQPRSGNIELILDPAVGESQRVTVFLNEFFGVSPPPGMPEGRSYSFAAPSRFPLSPPASPPGSTTNITFPFSGVVPGAYLIRVQVDGAESPLGPETGLYSSPVVNIS